jgi:S-adenosylmethionine hydrolase
VADVNSLLNLSIAINKGNFAQAHKLQSGADWHLDVRRPQ